MSKKTHLLDLTRSAVFGALIFVATRFIAIPLPAVGYVHLGDAVLFLGASVLPLPYAIAAAAFGSAMADLTAGFAAYIPATILIKGLTACCFTSKKEKLLCTRNYLAPIGGLVLCAGGYFTCEAILYGVATATISIPFNCLQIVASAIVYFPLAAVLSRRKMF